MADDDTPPAGLTTAQVRQALGLAVDPDDAPATVKADLAGPAVEVTPERVAAALGIRRPPRSRKRPKRPPVFPPEAAAELPRQDDTTEAATEPPRQDDTPPLRATVRPLTETELARLVGGLRAMVPAPAHDPPADPGPPWHRTLWEALSGLWSAGTGAAPVQPQEPPSAPVQPSPAPPEPPPMPPDRPARPTMNLGTISGETAALEAMVRQRRQWHEDAQRDFKGPKGGNSSYDLLHLADYIHAVKNRRSLVRDLPTDDRPNSKLSTAQQEFLERDPEREETPDEAGWRHYLTRVYRCPDAVKNALAKCSNDSALPEASRRKHTLIFGPSDWGKSELVKALLYHYAEEDGAAVVVLDPGGDLCKQVSRWPELVHRDRLRLVQPNIQDGFTGLTVGINPLDGRGLDIEDRRKVAGDWAETLGVLSNDLTPNMLLLVSMCVQVLLAFPGGVTLDDLCRLLLPREKAPRGSDYKRQPPKDERTAALLKFARNYEVGQVADFFRDEFDAESVENTRWALLRRLKLVLNYPHAQALLTGETTLDLEREINARRFILVDLSRFGKQGSRAVGRLFVALLSSIGRRRESVDRENRTPTHLFIDEASTMVSAQMFDTLREMRKFGVYLTMVQQVAGDEMTPAQKQLLRANTGCKLIAPASQFAAWAEGADDITAPKIAPGEFLVSWAAPRGEETPVVQKLVVRSDLADDRHAVPGREWLAHLERITGPQGYYRSAALAGPSPFDKVPWETADDTPPAPPPPRRSAPPRRATPPTAEAAGLPDDVPPELAGRFRSTTGLKGDF